MEEDKLQCFHGLQFLTGSYFLGRLLDGNFSMNHSFLVDRNMSMDASFSLECKFLSGS